MGEDDAIATHAQLLAEKRIGFYLLAFGLTIHLTGLVLKSPVGPAPMAVLAVGVIVAGLIATFIWTRIVGKRVLRQASEAERKSGGEEFPEQ